MYTQKNTDSIGAVRILKGTLFSVLVYLVTLGIGTFLILLSKNPTANTAVFSLGIFLLSGAVSAFILSKSNHGNIILSIIPGVLFSLIILIVGLIFKGNILALLMNIVCYLLVFAFFSFLATLKPKQKKRKRR